MKESASVSQTDHPSDAQMLCVSIHDVAPATWTDCLRLVEAVRAVADVPLTWLVVPHYHFRPEQSPGMEACLNVALERGDELALHGYSHLDTEAAGGGLRSRFLRNVYTRREGEFAALTEAEARRRLELGLEWFAARGWTPTGFVPPAWLLGEGAWRALRDAPFDYTTTFSHFHCLPRAYDEDAHAHAHATSAPRSAERSARGQVRHGAGNAQDRRGGHGVSVQSGGGSVQYGGGNYSGQGSPSRQFDAANWTGARAPGDRADVHGRHDAGSRTALGQHDPLASLEPPEPQQPQQRAPQPQPPALREPLDLQGLQSSDDPRRPFTQNNRRGTHAILSPSLVYAARNRSGRILSPRVADATAAMLAQSPLVRFSLHPPDSRYPELVRHIQRVLERLLERREAVTKAEFARRLVRGFTNTDPISRPSHSQDPSRSSPAAAQRAANRTSC
ncbi:polysaccharide deacetylase family protein [Massilia pinisoli]|uniref:Polysaccharide deacetylase family protein n=1 Tax=Massilia pinisoli TaxID=1772194 RepID=A0ABT1ZXJ6_9BURK|nr:polysaccharide deacetylase family protein [Massilia pinisoli]MCS0584590.1 polysaccharide deacetylase family protein [Massilia pinisoli]